jgi:hypothetical protein
MAWVVARRLLHYLGKEKSRKPSGRQERMNHSQLECTQKRLQPNKNLDNNVNTPTLATVSPLYMRQLCSLVRIDCTKKFQTR